MRRNGLAELKELTCTGTVEDYQRQFFTSLCRYDDMTPMQQAQMFTAGLGEPLHTDVDLAAPTDLQAAMHLARAYERRLTMSKMGAKQTTSTAKSIASSATVTSASWPLFRHRSPEELVAMCANGECYRCTKKFTPDHKCASKGVFLLEMDDDVEVDTTADELGISLHALTSIDVANTMKLHVRIKGKTLVALVDTGSTHTFIKEGLLPQQLGLEVTPREGLTVKVANSERVTSGGVCRAAEMDIGSEHFNTNFYVLPLDGFDVVLGVQWLRTLGPILWDFDDLKMTF
jgi:hypothetical protein